MQQVILTISYSFPTRAGNIQTLPIISFFQSFTEMVKKLDPDAPPSYDAAGPSASSSKVPLDSKAPVPAPEASWGCVMLHRRERMMLTGFPTEIRASVRSLVTEGWSKGVQKLVIEGAGESESWELYLGGTPCELALLSCGLQTDGEGRMKDQVLPLEN